MQSNTFLDRLRLIQDSPPTPSQLIEVVSAPSEARLGHFAWVFVADMGALRIQRLTRMDIYAIGSLLQKGTLNAEPDTYTARVKDVHGHNYDVVLRNITIPEDA